MATLPIDTTPPTELVEGTLEVMGGTCYPTHHDYQQANGIEYSGLPVMFCRLCGDVRSIAVEPSAVTITED